MPVQKLTGTLRGLERDALVKEDPIFARFMPKPTPEVAPEQGTVFLVCTSAGEVGVNISADHLVCDLTPFDSMVQRFGRVNRFGDGDARIDLVYPLVIDEKDTLREVRQRTLALLRRLPQEQDGHDASPAALHRLPIADRQAAFTPPPVILPATDILFDAWALTSIRGKLPGRPPVADWLHGVAEWEPPETFVAWREEVELITPGLQEKYRPEDLLDDYALKPHELLRDKTWRIFSHLEKLARRHPELSAWVLESDGGVSVVSLAELVEKDRQNKPEVNLAGYTVLLPPAAGGLIKGTLNGDAEFDPDRRTLYDVADRWIDERGPRRCREWDAGQPPAGMRLVRAIDTRRAEADDEPGDDEQPASPRYWQWYVRPGSTLLVGADLVQYLWLLADPLTNQIHRHVEALADIARSVVALGWGVDMVVGHGAIVSDEQANALPGERWLPGADAAGGGSRVPKQGTLDDLIHRHARFLERLGADGFTAPPPLSVYDTVAYRRATDRRMRPVASFSLLKLDASGFRAFDTARRALTVAGMTRHVAGAAARSAGWDEPGINGFILGHGDSRGGAEHVAVGPRRFAYLPLPTLEARGEGMSRVVGSVRRVMLSSFAEGCDAEIAWARRARSGHELVGEDKQRPVALLALIPESERVVRHYTQPAASWATVTPVVLPGYDDPGHYRRRLKRGTSAEEQKQLLTRLDERVNDLLRKAITQCGFSKVLADHAELQWRKAGFWPGTDHADRYGVPDHLRRFPCLHVRLHWRDPQGRPVQVPGPVCFGSGRSYGLGLFAPFEADD
ncbi:MAG: type I-U CRISPR-associated helicase/endonuclease Cas3 [Gemmatimonadetes bacterium]|nr:type I-U CRISPR-associated helicase/endonuclease Cas3 [Gemmatimonadota bacterium]